MKKLLLPLLALAALLAPAARADIDLEAIKPDGFARAVAFTVDGYAGNSTLTDFPVLVRISETAISGFDYDDMMFPSTGDDIAFVAADGTALAYDIDTWDPTGTSLVWVKLPSMQNGTQFAMFYRSSKSGKTLNSANPFADYVGVWHMNDAGNGGATVVDAGPYGLTATAGAKSVAKTDGMVGGARQITTARAKEDAATKVTATTDAINALNTLGREFSVSFWARPQGTIDNATSGSIGYDGLIGRKSAGNTAAWAIQVTDNPKKVRLWTSQTSDSNFAVTGEIFNFARETWGKIDVVYTYTNTANASTPQQITAYWNGVKTYGPGSPSGNKQVEQGSLTLAIGGYAGSSERPFLGDMDEVRVSTIIPTADRVKADYDTVNSAAFLSAGTVVEFVELPKPVGSFSLVDSGAAFAQFGGSISSLGGEATSADVLVRVWPTDGTAPSQWTTLATALAAGDTFEGFVTGLTPETAYTYEIKAVNDLATPYDSDVATDEFTTSGSGDAGTGGDAKRVGDSIVHTFVIDSELGDTWEFTPPAYATSVEALVVAGGGPGGYWAGAGGGAGGLVYDTALPITGGATYTVKVGAGGVASSAATSYGTNGGDSTIYLGDTEIVTAVGGGAGGNGALNNQVATAPGVSGGSGGGSTGASYAAGTATSGQGFPGGTGLNTGNPNRKVGAGGGGAGGAGGSVSGGNTVSGGSGGDGLEFSISGTPTYYAGGGGGGGLGNSDTAGSVGAPGGGGRGGAGKGGMYTRAGEENEIAGSGQDNTGGGGGGGSTIAGYYQGGDGGSGIVIIRYPIQGDGTTEPEPAVGLTGATYDAETGKVSFDYRVAWAGYGYQLADVGVVWGYSPSALTTTNIVATDKIGSGSGEITLPQVSRTVYLRAVAVNAAGLSGVSVAQKAFTLFNPNAPVGTIALSSAAVTNATFAVEVTDLGSGAESASVTVQVCSSEDFTGTVLSFPAAETLAALGTVSVGVNGLAQSSTYYARAVVVNDDDVELTTDPVEFTTYAPGAPVATARTGDIGFTTLGAIARVSDFGAYASSATVRLEVSTQEDFSTLDAVSAEEPIALNADKTLVASGLDADTYYYRRVRVVNDWGSVLYVAVPYTSTRAVPFAASGPSWATGDGTVDISLAVSAVYDGAQCSAVLTYGGEEVGTQTFDAAGAVTWSGVAAKADGTVATIVVTATVDGEDYTRTFSAPVTAGAGATAITSIDAYGTYGDNALWLRPGDVAMLPDLYGAASYQVLNDRFVSISGSTLTALEPGIVGIRCVDASYTTNVMGVVVLPDSVGSGSVYVFKESKRNNTYDWARPECWDKVVFADGAATRAASNDSYPQNADDIAVLPFYAAAGDLYIRHRTDIAVGGLYSGMIRPDTYVNCVLERYKDDTTKTVTFERTDGEPVQIVVCPNNEGSNYSRIRLGGYTIDVVWASDAVIDCGSSETDWNNGLRGFFDVKELSSPNISTNTLQGVTLTFRGYPGYSIGGNNASGCTAQLYGFWKGTGTLVKEGMGGIVFNNDIGGLSGNIVLKGQKTPGGIYAPSAQFSIRGGGATNLAATVYGVVALGGNGQPTSNNGAGLFGTSAQVGAAPPTTVAANTYNGVSGSRGPDAPAKGLSLVGGSWYAGRIDNTTWGVDAEDDKVLDFLGVGAGMSYIYFQPRNNNTAGYPINVVTAKELRQTERGTLALSEPSRYAASTATSGTRFYAEDWEDHAIGAAGACETETVHKVIPWIVASVNDGNWGNCAFATFDENGRLVQEARENVNIDAASSEDANLYANDKNLNNGTATDITINSLYLANNNKNKFLGADRTLRIKSGGVILSGQSSSIGLPGRDDNGSLVLGDATHPAYVWAKAYNAGMNYIGAAVTAPGGFVAAYLGNLGLVGDQTGIAQEIAVNAGTLSIGTADADCKLASGLPIRVCTGATLSLPKSGAVSSNAIKLDGFGKNFAKVALPVDQKCASLSVRDVSETAEWTELPDGTYGSSASAAEFVDDDRFAGPGILTVGAAETVPGTVLLVW